MNGTALIVCAVASISVAAVGEDMTGSATWRFPASMKVVDVKEGFGAVGDGVHDDTEALQKAFDQRDAFVYLPDGTYLIRDQLQYTSGPGIGPTIQGQSRDGVVLKLAPDALGFDDPDDPKAVVRLIRDGKVSADYFKIRVRSLTIDAGEHPGATGMMFYSNNNGTCRDVRIVGGGAVGLDLSYMLNGPLLVSDVEIKGFDIGIKAGSGPYNSQTLEHIVLRGQSEWGLYNDGDCLMMRGIRSFNACPAVFTRGNMVLVDSELTGGSPENSAVVWSDQLFVRNLTSDGYGRALQERRTPGRSRVEDGPAVEQITEWVSRPGRSTSGAADVRSLNLSVEEPPCEPLEADFDQWVCVDDFGADGTDKQDDTAAIRRAIRHAADSGKTVLCFAADGRYIAHGDLAIYGSIRRLQGAKTYLLPPRGESLRILVEEGDSPTVTLDLLDRPLGRMEVVLENASSRPLVVNHFRGQFVGSGPGRTFLNDACSNVRITNPEHRVWVRQLNSESGSDVNNHNDGGMLWVLGLKSERDQTLVMTTAGGQTEVLGAWVYVTSREAPTHPMFRAIDSPASFAGILQWHWQGKTYPVLLDAMQNGRHREITAKEQGGRASATLLVTRP
jgi:hypothetical protein